MSSYTKTMMEALAEVRGIQEADLDEGKKEKGPRQLIDPNKEVMVVKKNKVIVINKKDQDKYLKQGWTLAEEVELDEALQAIVWKTKPPKGTRRVHPRSKWPGMKPDDIAKTWPSGKAGVEEVDLDEGKMSQLHQYIKDKKSPEEIAKMMKLDVKTVKALMAGYMSSSKMMASYESYEIGTPEYREHTQEVTPGQEITDFQRFKVESMKEALAKVWGLDEAKKEEKKENKDLTKASKSGKVITGSDADEIDLKPKTAK
jgi:hypothetical protein